MSKGREKRKEGKGRGGGEQGNREARREGRSCKRKVKRERGRSISRWHCVGEDTGFGVNRLGFESVTLFEHPVLKRKDKDGPCMFLGM